MLKLSFPCRRSASSGPYPDPALPCPVQQHGRGSILSGVVGNGFWENLSSLRPWTDPVRAEMSNVAVGTGDKTSLPWSASESLGDIHPGRAGAEQKRSWKAEMLSIGAACQIATEGCALLMPSFPTFFRRMGLKWNALWNPGALRAQSGWRGKDGYIDCWSLGRWALQPTAWGLPKETDVAQLVKRIPSHLSHFSQVMNLAKCTSPSLRQERHQQTQPDGSELEFWSDSFHSSPASLGHDSTSWDFVLIWSTEKPGSHDGDGIATQAVTQKKE